MANVAPTDQRAAVRPISFVLDTGFDVRDPVTLPIRPEDLTRNEPARVSVNQTLGRQTQGWADHFGEGLPSLTITGHTGWRYNQGSGEDGFQAFETLNNLVVHQYPTEKQKAIDNGTDPAKVRLLFLDVLDNFAWSVVPTQFTLRRSKSRPLLFQYNIALQALDTNIDKSSPTYRPFTGSSQMGLNALGSAIGNISGMLGTLQPLVYSSFPGISGSVMGFSNYSVGMLTRTQSYIGGVNGLNTASAGIMIGLAQSVGLVGRQAFRTLATQQGISLTAQMAFSRMASAYNEIVCIFANALRPRVIYEDYEPLFGASNCSSTTGGRLPSAYASANVFESLTTRADLPVSVTGTAIQSTTTLINTDPVLYPMDTAEIGRHLANITAGSVIT